MLTAHDAAVAVATMKRGEGDPLRLIGSLSVGRSLLRAGLVDRWRLLTFPLVLGETGAEPAFAGLPDLPVEPRDVRLLDGRIVATEYAPLAPR